MVNKKLLQEMLAAYCHVGHKASKWNPKMKPYLFDKREGVHIFDLEKSAECLEKALAFLKEAGTLGKVILLTSTKLHATKLVEEAAKRVGAPYVTKKWMPGLLTNFETLKKRIKYFKDLKDAKANGEWDKYTKKERLELQRTLDKLEEAFSGVEFMTKLPDVVLVLDTVRDALALREARRLGIPTVGICDSNADPDLLTYPMPGNDDAIKSLKFFAERISQAIEDGKKLFTSREPGKREIEQKQEAATSPSQPETPVV